MSAYGYIELFAIGVWMLMHTLVHLYPLILSLAALVTVGPMLARVATRMPRASVEA